MASPRTVQPPAASHPASNMTGWVTAHRLPTGPKQTDGQRVKGFLKGAQPGLRSRCPVPIQHLRKVLPWTPKPDAPPPAPRDPGAVHTEGRRAEALASPPHVTTRLAAEQASRDGTAQPGEKRGSTRAGSPGLAARGVCRSGARGQRAPQGERAGVGGRRWPARGSARRAGAGREPRNKPVRELPSRPSSGPQALPAPDWRCIQGQPP